MESGRISIDRETLETADGWAAAMAAEMSTLGYTCDRPYTVIKLADGWSLEQAYGGCSYMVRFPSEAEAWMVVGKMNDAWTPAMHDRSENRVLPYTAADDVFDRMVPVEYRISVDEYRKEFGQ
jgi:hypothetical protein